MFAGVVVQLRGPVLPLEHPGLAAQPVHHGEVLFQHQPAFGVVAAVVHVYRSPAHAVALGQAMGGAHQGGVLAAAAERHQQAHAFHRPAANLLGIAWRCRGWRITVGA